MHALAHMLALNASHTSTMPLFTATINSNELKMPNDRQARVQQIANALVFAAQEHQPSYQLCVEAAYEIATVMVAEVTGRLTELNDPCEHFILDINVDMDLLAKMAQQLKNVQVKRLQAEQKLTEKLDSLNLN